MKTNSHLSDLLLWALATWRLTSLLGNVNEAGPADLLHRLRKWAGVWYDEHNQPQGRTGLARGLLCHWCCSVWIGSGWALLAHLWPGAARWLALPLALSTASIALERWINDTHG